jgi:predicted GIY-YIG superfamily endonuclease
MKGVYLIHFEEKFKHAQHYLGYADNIQNRINRHKSSRGATLIKFVLAAGIKINLVRVWQDKDREFERKLKNRSHIPKLCPICGNPKSYEKPILSRNRVKIIEQ